LRIASRSNTHHNSVMEQVEVKRHTVRILLVDPANRLLLFHGMDPLNPSDHFWCPIGGGIEGDEAPAEAALREVFEETGLKDFDLGPHIWNRQAKYQFNGTKYHTFETWYFSRVPEFVIDSSGFEEVELSSFIEYRWWTSEELLGARENLTPRKLGELYKGLLLSGLPKIPVDLGLEIEEGVPNE